MEIVKRNGVESSNYLVVVGPDRFEVSGFDVRIIEALVKEGTECSDVKSPDSMQVGIKGGLKAENLRKQGAQIRKQLDRTATTIDFYGPVDDVYFLMEGFILAGYQFLKYLSKASEKAYQLEKIRVPNEFPDYKITELLAIRKAVFWSRDMVNEPVSFLNAERFAHEIASLADQSEDLSVTILEKTQIESLKMGGLLAVNKGSIDPPTFTILEYKPKNAVNSKPVVLVGKGVVYDTGGLSLKPTPNSMDVMKSDMAGGACMVGATFLSALMRLPVHIVTLVPATDNRPGLNAYAPGDIVKMYNGTTVEVLNTDAEGRMILADALAYSTKFNPEVVLEASTLTGAAVRAIGECAAIIMGNAADEVFTNLEAAGNNTFERVVRFPFWEEYGEEMKSQIADLKNLGGANAGMISAGKFLEHFVKAPYVHMDIAGPAWIDKDNAYRTKGGTGYGVRLLYNYFNSFSV